MSTFLKQCVFNPHTVYLTIIPIIRYLLHNKATKLKLSQFTLKKPIKGYFFSIVTS